MQCISCGFENLPGLRSCARCQSLMDLAAVAVVPPRAPALRVLGGLHRLRYAARDALAVCRAALPSWRPLTPEPVYWPALLRTLVPGWGHLYLRNRWLGRILLASWLFCWLFLLINFPSEWTSWHVAGLVTVHTVAFLSLFATNLAFERIWLRALFGVLLFFALDRLLYRPVGALFGRFYEPLAVPHLANPGETVATGDGLLYEGAWLRPKHFARGDLVVYTIPEMAGSGWIIREGLGLDRVLGVPGDHVEIKDGALLVNGQPPPAGQRPLGGTPHFFNLNLKVPENKYVIFPSRLALVMDLRELTPTLWPALAEVPAEQIRGRVVFRLQPWSRFGFVR